MNNIWRRYLVRRTPSLPAMRRLLIVQCSNIVRKIKKRKFEIMPCFDRQRERFGAGRS